MSDKLGKAQDLVRRKQIMEDAIKATNGMPQAWMDTAIAKIKTMTTISYLTSKWYFWTKVRGDIKGGGTVAVEDLIIIWAHDGDFSLLDAALTKIKKSGPVNVQVETDIALLRGYCAGVDFNAIVKACGPASADDDDKPDDKRGEKFDDEDKEKYKLARVADFYDACDAMRTFINKFDLDNMEKDEAHAVFGNISKNFRELLKSHDFYKTKALQRKNDYDELLNNSDDFFPTKIARLEAKHRETLALMDSKLILMREDFHTVEDLYEQEIDRLNALILDLESVNEAKTATAMDAIISAAKTTYKDLEEAKEVKYLKNQLTYERTYVQQFTRQKHAMQLEISKLKALPNGKELENVRSQLKKSEEHRLKAVAEAKANKLENDQLKDRLAALEAAQEPEPQRKKSKTGNAQPAQPAQPDQPGSSTKNAIDFAANDDTNVGVPNVDGQEESDQ